MFSLAVWNSSSGRQPLLPQLRNVPFEVTERKPAVPNRPGNLQVHVGEVCSHWGAVSQFAIWVVVVPDRVRHARQM
jgi:hypothetical protein